PTTAGTGSEAQSFALISQRGSHVKMACGDKKARFRAVILDPFLTASMPRQVAAVTAMDAVSHALESYVTTRRNPVSQMLSREAWRLLAGNFKAALENPDNSEIRGRMLVGAHWAGAAIENSMLGAAHATANPLTARYGITHGIAVGLMLPHVVRFNGSVAGGCYQELLSAAGASNGSPESSPERLSQHLVRFKQAAGLPLRLRDCGVCSDDFPLLAQQATQQWTGTFNPRKLNQDQFIELYEKAF
ncbi:MAG: iron-containing alcohol dehydrogenase, partial [Acidobacteriota bacterium]